MNMNGLFKLVAITMTFVFVVGCKYDAHAFSAEVIEIGDCVYDGPYTCRVKVKHEQTKLDDEHKTDDDIMYVEVWGTVMKGQTIYRLCWFESSEKEKRMCFVPFRTSVPNGYELRD
ncbi:hypothetical protein PBI_SCTP2_356 [Salicola phage SCTP-2]|nr:hypothetical protein PBI_SCTP2_356 [Salicola phage SCTP-2]